MTVYGYARVSTVGQSQIEAGNAFISGLTGATTGVKWGSKLGPCGAVGAYIGGYN